MMKTHDKVEVECMPKKRSFKVWLDSNDTSSYSGKQFNASYNVDFSQVIRDPAGYNKPYYMTIQFLSRYAVTGTNNISQNEVYKLHIDMGRGINAYQNNKIKLPSALVRVNSLVNGASLFTWFDAKPTDNEPMYIENLRDEYVITLQLIDSTTNSTFNNADDGTINTATKYVACLTFTEA